jgi:hypothetical protein
MEPEQLQRACIAARAAFYTRRDILRRSVDPVNRADFFMWRNFYMINGMLRGDVSARDDYPLGDRSWKGTLIEATA